MQNSNEKAQYAGFWVRLCAYVIDCVLIAIPLVIIRLILFGITSVFEGTFLTEEILFQYTFTDIVIYLCRAVYFVACTYMTGTTVGKKLLNLKVVTVDEGKPGLVDVIYRETVGRFLNNLVCGLGYVFVGLDSQKRGFHDFLCDTRVVYTKKVKVYQMNQESMQFVPQQVEEPVQNENEVWHLPEQPQNDKMDGETKFERPWQHLDDNKDEENN